MKSNQTFKPTFSEKRDINSKIPNGKANTNIAVAIAISLFLDPVVANSGVILEKKPVLKNYVEEAPAVVSKPKSLPKVQIEKQSKNNNINKSETSESFSIPPQTIALPG